MNIYDNYKTKIYLNLILTATPKPQSYLLIKLRQVKMETLSGATEQL